MENKLTTVGFPSPAENDMEEPLDLHQLLVKHPAATFFLRASGDAMKSSGIYHNDILIVDRSLEPQDGKTLVVILNGELAIRRLHKEGKKLFLLTDATPIELKKDTELQVWGIVTHVIHSL